MRKNHHIIVIPGLGGTGFLFYTTVKLWRLYGVTTEVFDMKWHEEPGDFEARIHSLMRRIDQLHTTGKTISLVGTSAGGSAVVNAFYRRTDKINRVVNVCGRLRAGTNVSPSLEWAARNSDSFRQSVLTCEEVLMRLSEEDRSRILTVLPLFDEIVPVSTMSIPGAKMMRIWTFEHLLSLSVAMTFFAKSIIRFLREEG